MADAAVRLGTGIYSTVDAARLLGLDRTRVRRWVNGYTYHYRYRAVESKRRQPAIVKPDLAPIGKDIALSFVELMELRVVRVLILDKKLSLQRVRVVASLAASLFGTTHPFASRPVYTHGKQVFMHLQREAGEMVELERKRIQQIIAGPIFEPFLEEIDFDEQTALASRWWPLGRTVPVLLDPRIAFGAPVIAGTRIRTNVIAGMAGATTPEVTARTYRLDSDEVEAAVRFERQLAAA